MVRGFLLLAGLVVCTVGCMSGGTTFDDGKGNKVSVDANGTKMSATDDKGNSSSLEGNTAGGTVKVTDAQGKTSTMTSGTTVSEADLGLPFYPGSSEKSTGSIKTDTPENTTVMSARSTADDPLKVSEFYKAKLKNATASSVSSDASKSEMVSGELENGAKVQVGAVKNKDATTTDITVVVTLEKKK
ncbi:MAG: hypothetical protein JSS66_02710 [Armatimonadetes bacterium]|nr:hypothetical protein [Armatimonadota bacterium]